MIFQTATNKYNTAVNDFSVIGLGELMVEFVEENPGLDTNVLYHQSIGGDVFNTLYALNLYKNTNSFISSVGNDIFKEFILINLQNYNTDTQMIKVNLDYNNGIYFIKVTPDQNRIIQSYRETSAAKFTLTDYTYERILDFCKKSKIFYFTGITLAITYRRDLLMRLIQDLKNAGIIIAYDTNVRPQLWQGNLKLQKDTEEQFLQFLDFIFITKDDSLEEISVETLEEMISYYRGFKIPHIISKDGPNGSDYFTYDGTDGIHCDAVTNVTVVDTTGAGDAFNGGFLAGILEKKEMKECLEMGTKVATACIQVKGAINYSI